MWSEARHQRIQLMLQRYERVTTTQVMAALEVSRETVRRDFLELEAIGLLKRVHGGAVHISDEPPIDKRSTLRVAAKQAIAKATAQRINRPLTLFMDAGSTTTLLAKELSLLSELTIITNSLDAAESFRQQAPTQNNQIIILGGELSGHLAATTGSSTIAHIQRFHADIALLSPVGIDARHGASSFHHDEASIARAMSESAHQTWILADHNKIGTHSRETYCPVQEINVLISNTNASHREGFEELAACIDEIVLV
ncbi:DeoR/GlpR family DNA-binding transcription regulator [Alcaligenaceae bacterium CGII-47]|nr:DeoR/GlpR family DNA-binding transcription regulator [Alcaligenaceae bacterium CGII-47]